jgi:hypothetical protein
MFAIALRFFPAALVAVAALTSTSCGSPSNRTYTLSVPARSNATPWIAAAGRFVAVAWGASAGAQSDVYVAVSRDEGRTFTEPIRVNRDAGEARLNGEQPPRVGLVPTATSADPILVVLWTAGRDRTQIKSTVSRDGGGTFEPPVSLESPEASGARGWAALTIDSSAKAHAVWVDHREHSHGGTSAGHSAHQRTSQWDGVAMAQKSALYYAAADGSRPEQKLTGSICYCCKTSLVAAGERTLFAAWRHVYPGNFRDMAFAVSHDQGASFSDPVRVSEDGWSINACPDDGPALAADSSGAAHIVWPTVVNGPKPESAIFYASTTDGRTFSPRLRIPTLGGSHPRHPQIAIDKRGRIVVAWDEMRNGRRVAAARELTVGGNQEPTFGDPLVIDPDDSAEYPVLASTASGIAAAWTSGRNATVVRVRLLALQ